MKETTGTIKEWDGTQGNIRGDDGKSYTFSHKEWSDKHDPEIGGGVLVISQNGRDASKVEHLPIEHIPSIQTKIYSKEGKPISTEKQRFIGGPHRMYSDAKAWMKTARGLHKQLAQYPIDNISSLLLGEHSLISFRGSIIKYCYGFAIELYLKWILTEAKIEYRANHNIHTLLARVPIRVLDKLRTLYSTQWDKHKDNIRLMIADINSTREVDLDWSTFDNFIKNIDDLKFIVGRYAAPEDYSIMRTSSSKLSKEMNMYMDADGFFEIANAVLSYKPDLGDYESCGNLESFET